MSRKSEITSARLREADASATRWAHMYNDLFHTLEPWLRKRAAHLRHEIGRGQAFLNAGPESRFDPEPGSAWRINEDGWKKSLPDYRAELAAIDHALAQPAEHPARAASQSTGCGRLIVTEVEHQRCTRPFGHTGICGEFPPGYTEPA